MTRQEVINGLLYDLSPQSLTKKENELIDLAIKELSKQPETLSRRDEIASRLLQGILANSKWNETIKDDWDDYAKRVTEGSVELADALIEQLDKGKE